MIYAFTQVQKARGGSWRLQGDGAGQVFLLSSGEDPIAAFVGKGEDREGRERRMPDIPAEVPVDRETAEAAMAEFDGNLPRNSPLVRRSWAQATNFSFASE
jgi:hypothetical protein